MTGDGTQGKPCGTIQYPIGQILDATATKLYAVHVASESYTGTATTAVIPKPYIVKAALLNCR
jgi:hypothetical protein